MGTSIFIFALFLMTAVVGFILTPPAASPVRGSIGSAKTSMLLVLVVFAVGAATYLAIGGPGHSGATSRAIPVSPGMTATPRAGESGKIASVTSLLGGLEARLRANPDDAKGWLLLARSYRHLGREEDAAAAYEKAAALGVTDAALAGQIVLGQL